MNTKINSKEYESMDMSDHVVAQEILDMLERHNCLSEKGKVFKQMYFEELNKEGYLDEELRDSLKHNKSNGGKKQ